MRRSASEVINELEARVDHLERSATSKKSSTMSWDDATSLISSTLSSTARLSDEEAKEVYRKTLVELSSFLRQHKNELNEIRGRLSNQVGGSIEELGALVGMRR